MTTADRNSEGRTDRPEQLGLLLQRSTEEVMRRFELRIRGGLAAETLAPFELRDGLPGFLRRTAELLKPRTGAEPGDSVEPAVAEEHGEQRLRLGFDPGAVVREYGVLRDCIWEIAEEAHYQPTSRELRVLSDAFTIASSQAIAEYIRLRDEELKRQATEHLSFLAHELRNPLQSARLGVQLLQKRGQWPDARPAEGIRRSLERIGSLVDTALTHGKLQADVALQQQVIVLSDFLQDIAEESEVDAQSKGIELKVEASKAVEACADLRLLRSAVSNFIRNAVKFTHEGHVVVRVVPEPSFVRIEVEDSCGGLPPGHEERLFEPFVQANADRSGFGLGLAIARQAIEAQQGQVFVKNLPGRGCLFGLKLPVRAPDDCSA